MYRPFTKSIFMYFYYVIIAVLTFSVDIDILSGFICLLGIDKPCGKYKLSYSLIYYKKLLNNKNHS